MWLGLFKNARKHRGSLKDRREGWVWSDNTTYARNGWTRWYTDRNPPGRKSQPSGKHECVIADRPRYRQTFDWYDQKCRNRNAYVCEKGRQLNMQSNSSICLHEIISEKACVILNYNYSCIICIIVV